MASTRIVICNNRVVGITRADSPHRALNQEEQKTLNVTSLNDSQPILLRKISNDATIVPANHANSMQQAASARKSCSEKQILVSHDSSVTGVQVSSNDNELGVEACNVGDRVTISSVQAIPNSISRRTTGGLSTADTLISQCHQGILENESNSEVLLSEFAPKPLEKCSTSTGDNDFSQTLISSLQCNNTVSSSNSAHSVDTTDTDITQRRLCAQPAVTFRIVTERTVDFVSVKPVGVKTPRKFKGQAEETCVEDLPNVAALDNIPIPSAVAKGKVRYQCDLCSTTCCSAANLERHKMVHTIYKEDAYRYRCEVCDKEFLQHCDLRRHRLVHSNQYPHRCPHCGKGYLRENDMRRHVMFHEKVKAHVCPHCAKSFVQKGDMQRHVRNVHMKQAKLACGHCDRKYGSESTLIRHMQTKHRDVLIQTSDFLHDKSQD